MSMLMLAVLNRLPGKERLHGQGDRADPPRRHRDHPLSRFTASSSTSGRLQNANRTSRRPASASS